MKLWVIATALTAALASPALAGDLFIWVKPDSGNDAWGGTRPDSALTSLAPLINPGASSKWINRAPGLLGDDHYYILLKSGTSFLYDMPNFKNAPSNGKRWIVLGNVADNSLTKVAGGDLSKPYLSIHGVQFQRWTGSGSVFATYNKGGCVLTTGADFDSIVDCSTPAGCNDKQRMAWDGGRYSGFLRCTINNQNFQVGRDHWYIERNSTSGNFMVECSMPCLGKNVTTHSEYTKNPNVLWYNHNWVDKDCSAPDSLQHADSVKIWRNHFTLTKESGFVPTSGYEPEFMFAHGCWDWDLRYNRWDHVNHYTGGAITGMRLMQFRDSSRFTMVGDTILAYGEGLNKVIIRSSGSCPLSTGRFKIDSTFFYVEDAARGMDFQGLVLGDTITNSCFVFPDGAAASFFNVRAPTLVDHNTFAGRSYGEWSGFGGVVRFDNYAENDPQWPATITFTNNIVYGAPYNSGPASCDVNEDYGQRCAGNYFMPAMDSVVSRRHTINYNLYTYYGDSTCSHDGSRAIRWYDNGYHLARPGSGSKAWFFKKFKYDSLSVYGGPEFVSGIVTQDTMLTSARTLLWNWPRIGNNSAAKGAGSGGSNIGARAVYGPEADTKGLSLEFIRGVPGTRNLRIYSVGTLNLTVSAIATGNAHVTVSQDTAYIAPGTNRLVTVSYDGNQAPTMPYNLNIGVSSDAVTYPLTYVPVAIE